jgi:hypothetical protein
LELFALGGTLQKGPLAQYLQNFSVASWLDIGVQVFRWRSRSPHHLALAYDTYGDWYRQERVHFMQPLVLPGHGTITNAAHNVLIDALATNGFIYFFFYIG